MNCYFVFEGTTELVVYNHWLKVLAPHLKAVNSPKAVQENNFWGVPAGGFYSCVKAVGNAVADICENPVFDYLVVFVDADDSNEMDCEAELQEEIEKELQQSSRLYKQLPRNCKLLIIVQKVCIETWFLGNQKFVPTHHLTEELKTYLAYYDIQVNDPELLAANYEEEYPKHKNIFGYATKAQFHEGYLVEIFKSRTRDGRSYKKERPRLVTDPTYLQQLIHRHQQTQHLSSFGTFLQFCQTLNA
jgi:hypothetical protein